MKPAQKKGLKTPAEGIFKKRHQTGEPDADSHVQAVVATPAQTEASTAANPDEAARAVEAQAAASQGEPPLEPGFAGAEGQPAENAVYSYYDAPEQEGLQPEGTSSPFSHADEGHQIKAAPASAEMMAGGAVFSPGTLGGVGSGLLGAAGAGGGGLSAGTVGAIGLGVAAAGAGVAVAAGGGSKSSSSSPVTSTTPASSGPLLSVADGRIAGATVYADANGNGVYDAGIDTTVVGSTAADGTLRLSAVSTTALFAVGGTNIDTGLANNLVLSTAAGSSVINPITTLIAQYVAAGASQSVAEAAVKAALGLSGVSQSLLEYDPLVTGTSATDPTALAVQKAAVALATAASNAESLGQGDEFLAAIAQKIADGSFSDDNPLDLSSAAALAVIDGAVAADLSGVLAEITRDVDAIQAATTLAQSGEGSLTLAQGGALDESVVTYTSVAAAAASPAAAKYNIVTTAADLLAGGHDAIINNALNILVTGNCTVDQAEDIQAFTNLGATSLTISDSAAHLISGGQAAAAVTGAVDVIVNSQISLADLAVIDAATTGEVTAGTIADTAGHLAANAGGYINHSVDVIISDPPSLAQIALIDAMTTGDVSYTAIADTVAHLISGSTVNALVEDGVAVTILGTATVEQVALIDAANGSTGTVTAETLTGTAADLIASNCVSAGTNVIVLGTATLVQLAQLDAANGDGTLDYPKVSGTLSALTSDLGASTHYSQDHEVLITDEVHMAANASYTDTSAVGVNLTNLATLAGGASSVQFGDTVWASVAQILATDSLITGGVPRVEITDTVSLSELALIDDKVTGIVNAISISGTADALLAYAGKYVNDGTEFVITGEYSDAQYAALDALNGAGNVNVGGETATATSTAGWAPHLVSAVVGADGKTLVLTYDEAVNDTEPLKSAFTVLQDGQTNTVESIDHADGSNVLTLHIDNVHAGQTLTLSYDNHTITDDGTQYAAAVSNFGVTNNYDDAPPQFVQAAVTGAHTVLLGYDDGLAAGDVTGYSVIITHADHSTTTATISSATVLQSGSNFVTMTLAESLLATDSVAVSYAGSSLKGVDTLAVAALTQAAVVNSATPVLADMSGEPDSGTIILEFCATLDTTAQILSDDFTITVIHADDSQSTLDSVFAEYGSSGHSVHLLLDTGLVEGDTLRVSYHGSSIVDTSGAAADHFVSLDIVGHGGDGIVLATQAAFNGFEASGYLLSHSDSLWVDFSDDTTAGAIELGALHDVNSDQTLVLGHENGFDHYTDSSTQAYHVDMGTATFTELTLAGTGNHTVVLNNSVNDIVVNGGQGNLNALDGSTLDFSNVATGKLVAIDIHGGAEGPHAPDTGTATSYEDGTTAGVNAAGEYSIAQTGTSCDITYYDTVSGHAEVLHLTNLHSTATVALDQNGWVQVTN